MFHWRSPPGSCLEEDSNEKSLGNPITRAEGDRSAGRLLKPRDRLRAGSAAMTCASLSADLLGLFLCCGPFRSPHFLGRCDNRRPTGCAELPFWLRCRLRGRSCSWSCGRLQLGLTFYCGPPFALGFCHGFASRRADLPPCRFFRCRFFQCRCQSGLGRFPGKECAEFSYLTINTALLLFEAFDGGNYKFVREFWSRHL
jgi:hypothetical protein